MIPVGTKAVSFQTGAWSRGLFGYSLQLILGSGLAKEAGWSNMSNYYHPNMRIDNLYILVRRLGKGQFAEVWCAKDLSSTLPDQEVVLKLVHPDMSEKAKVRGMFEVEVNILDALKGVETKNKSRIVKKKEHNLAIEDFYIVLENVRDTKWRSLKEIVDERQGWLLEEEVFHIWHELVELGTYFHDKKIHKIDFKPEHIFWNEDLPAKIIMIDFNTSKINDLDANSLCLADIFCLGKLAYSLLKEGGNSYLDLYLKRRDWARGEVNPQERNYLYSEDIGIYYPIDWFPFEMVLSDSFCKLIEKTLNTYNPNISSKDKEKHTLSMRSFINELSQESFTLYSVDPSIKLIQDAIKKGNYSLAITFAEQAIDLHPYNPEASKLLTFSLLVQRSLKI